MVKGGNVKGPGMEYGKYGKGKKGKRKGGRHGY